MCLVFLLLWYLGVGLAGCWDFYCDESSRLWGTIYLSRKYLKYLIIIMIGLSIYSINMCLSLSKTLLCLNIITAASINSWEILNGKMLRLYLVYSLTRRSIFYIL